jgi:hypothetical protein
MQSLLSHCTHQGSSVSDCGQGDEGLVLGRGGEGIFSLNYHVQTNGKATRV